VAARGQPVACRSCGLIQKLGSADWLETIAQVYDAYTIYHQSPGAEQAVFDGASGVSAPRSERLLRRLLTECTLPAAGRLLDVGCGNGVLLRTVSQIAPAWTLAGADLDERHRETVERIPGVERFYAGPTDVIPDQFDVITMQHVLEHIPQPVDLLRKLAGRLNPSGVLFIQVPNVLDNPFDLMVVDHSSHFAPQTVRTAIERAGLRPLVLAADWAPKELTVVAAAGRRTWLRATGGVPLTTSRRACAGWRQQRRTRALPPAAGPSGCWVPRSPAPGSPTCWTAPPSSLWTRMQTASDRSFSAVR
jgi:2-polyprenyl-3-methyl-5-hydroxy-6-metoxy-1,4-benzoquinol methylase